MKTKYKILLTISIIVTISLAIGIVLLLQNNKNKVGTDTVQSQSEKIKEPSKHQSQQKNVASSQTEKDKVKHVSYDISNTKLPFSSVLQVSELPENIRETIKIAEEDHNVLYFIKENDKAILLVETTEDCPRHELEYIEINMVTGQQTHKQFETIVSKSEKDEWVYNEETNRPLKHIIKNSKGDTEYTETWNYDDKEPIKYMLKKADKIVSIKKETLDNDTTLRREHIIYDKDGKIKVNVSSIYNGPDMTSFTYFDSANENDSETIVSEYSENGVKVKEVVYSSDYKLKNSYEGEYKDGVLTDIQEITTNDSPESEK